MDASHGRGVRPVHLWRIPQILQIGLGHANCRRQGGADSGRYGAAGRDASARGAATRCLGFADPGSGPSVETRGHATRARGFGPAQMERFDPGRRGRGLSCT